MVFEASLGQVGIEQGKRDLKVAARALLKSSSHHFFSETEGIKENI